MYREIHGLFWFWLVLNGLAVYRLTRIATIDTVSDGWRSWLTEHFRGSAVELLLCGWCLSVWIAAGAVLFTWLFPAVWFWIALALAVSAIAGVALDREAR